MGQNKVSEKVVREKIKRAIGGDMKTTLLSNPSGQGFVGQLVNPDMFTPGGVAVVENARYISFGLGAKPGAGKGASFPDFVGWHEVEITPGMIGKTVAVFLGIEVKAPGKKATAEQQKKIDLIRNCGGIAEAATSAEEAAQIIKDFKVDLMKQGKNK